MAPGALFPGWVCRLCLLGRAWKEFRAKPCRPSQLPLCTALLLCWALSHLCPSALLPMAGLTAFFLCVSSSGSLSPLLLGTLGYQHFPRTVQICIAVSCLGTKLTYLLGIWASCPCPSGRDSSTGLAEGRVESSGPSWAMPWVFQAAAVAAGQPVWRTVFRRSWRPRKPQGFCLQEQPCCHLCHVCLWLCSF